MNGGSEEAGDLSARLARLGVRRGASDAPAARPPLPSSTVADGGANEDAALRDRLRRLLGGRGGAPTTVGVASAPIPGGPIARAEGVVHVADSFAPRAFVHGAARLDAARDDRAGAAAVAGRDPRLAASDPEHWAYFDIETTSLNSGAGVWVFLVGVGRFVGDVFRTRQFLLTGPESEGAFLAAIGEELASASALVSFHGKSFDAPRLDDRRRLASLAELCAGRPHWDLLHTTRRLFASRWPDCRLRTAEERLLGFERVGDLPGAECPAQYFAYLRGGRHRMADVVEHNRLDTVSLAALAGRLAETYVAAEAADPLSALVSGLDYAAAGDVESARPRLLMGVPAAGHLAVSQRDRARRFLRRYGESEAASAVAGVGLTVALSKPSPHDSGRRSKESAAGSPGRASRRVR